MGQILRKDTDDSRQLVKTYLEDALSRRREAPKDSDALKEQIQSQLIKNNAVLVAHYYCSPEIQELAEATGGCVADSLEMARFGKITQQKRLLWRA